MAESEKAFSKLSKTAEAETKALDARFRLAEATTKGYGTSLTGLSQKHVLLTEKLKLATTSTDALQRQYDILKDKPGVTAEALAKMSVRVDEAKIKQEALRQEWEKVQSPLQRYAIAADAVGEKLTKMGSWLTKYVTAPLIAAGTAVVLFTNKMADNAEQLSKMSATTGISVGKLQELRYVASQTSVDFDSITTAAVQLGRRLVEGTDDSKKLQEIISGLHIETQNLDGSFRSVNDLFPEVIAKLAGMEDITLRNKLALDLFGRGGYNLIPMLNAGQVEIDRLIARAHELDLVMSDEGVESLTAYGHKIEEIKQRFAMLGMELAQKLIPVLEDELVPFIEDTVIPSASKLVDRIGELTGAFNDLEPTAKAALEGVALGLIALGPGLVVLGKLLGLAKSLAAVWLGTSILGPVAGPVAIGLAAMLPLGLLMSADVKNIREELGRFNLAAKDMAGVMAGDIAPAAGIARDAIRELNEELAALPQMTPAQELAEGGREAQKLGIAVSLRQGKAPSPYKPGGTTSLIDVIRDKLAAIGIEIDIVKAKYDLFTGGLPPSASKMEILNAQLEEQKDELGLAGDKVTVLTDALAQMTATEGAAALQTRQLALDLLNAKIAYQELQQAISKTKKEMGVAPTEEQMKGWTMIFGRREELLKAGQYKEGLKLGELLPYPEWTPKDYKETKPLGYAMGGIAWTPQLALVGERGPEAITPLSQLGPTTVNQTLQFYGPTDEFGVRRGAQAAVADMMNSFKQQRRGV